MRKPVILLAPVQDTCLSAVIIIFYFRHSHCGSGVMNPLVSMKIWVQSLALLSGLRIWPCCEMWCRSQMRLRSGVAVAMGSWQLQLRFHPLAWELPHAAGLALKRRKKKKCHGWTHPTTCSFLEQSSPSRGALLTLKCDLGKNAQATGHLRQETNGGSQPGARECYVGFHSSH